MFLSSGSNRWCGMPKNRLESFSDCVIAFAITLLVLDIHLQDIAAHVGNAEMIQALGALGPHFLIYVISFLICTVAWVSHQELIHELDCVDFKLLWLNSLYLMWIALLPFPTSVLGHHPGQPVAIVLYGAVCSITCFTSAAMRWYASYRGHLMKAGIGPAKQRHDLLVSLSISVLYLAGMTVGFFLPWLGLAFYTGIPACYAVNKLLHRQRKASMP